MRILLLCVAIALAAEPALADDAAPVLRVDEVHEGMQGDGYTVFKGTDRERFTFVVRSIVPDFRGWPNVITGALTGCPDCSEGGKHMFEHHQIYRGMSGSPMYVDGKLIGGLAMAPDFATTSRVLITPIEYQFGMADMLEGVNDGHSTIMPGDYVGICPVYGARNWCIPSTVTARKDGRLFTTSHNIDIKHLKYDRVSLPVFQVSVADLLAAEKGATKLSGKHLQPIGTARVHGKFGFVIDEGDLPDTATVMFTVNGVFPKPEVFPFNMAYHLVATGALRQRITEIFNQLPDDPWSTRTEIAVRFAEPAGVVRLTDTFHTAMVHLENLLDRFIKQEKESLRIDYIDIRYESTETDNWRPVSIITEGKDDHATLTVLARRGRDNETAQFSEMIDVRPLKQYRKKKLVWWDGASLQRIIHELIPARESFDLLAQIEKREALYLVWIEDYKDILVDSDVEPGDWVQRLPQIRILLRPELGGNRFYIPFRENELGTSIPHVSR